MANLMPLPKMRFTDNNGRPLVGGKVFFYEAGSNTPKNTYIDSSGTTPNTNPVILDARGEASIWLISGYYKVKLCTSAGVEIWTEDKVSNLGEPGRIDNISALRAYPGLISGDQAVVTSYYAGWGALAAGPSGGGRFVWDAASTTTDDGGSVIAVTGVATGRWKRINPKFSPLEFGAVGTGAGDDTDKINKTISACPVGGDVVFDPGFIFRCTGIIQINKKINVSGSGELLFDGSAGIPNLINITAPEVKLKGLRLRHSGVNFTCRGIYVRADDVVIDGCDVLNFHSGIHVRFDGGEYFRSTITNNRVLDVRGFGLGPADTSNAGESDGDGIVTWGALATITGNIVTCKAGSDARIGIHCEGLSGGTGVVSQPPLSESLCTVSGNVVSGQFRRGIAFEDVENCTMVGNTVSDSTWWHCALVNTTGCVVSGNSVRYTRATGQNQGSFYSPVRSGIMAYGRNRNCVISSNVVHVKSGASCTDAISVQGVSGITPVDVQVIGNTISVDAASSNIEQVLTRGIFCRFGGEGLTVVGNIINNPFTSGIHMQNSINSKVDSNRVVGFVDATQYGIFMESADNSSASSNYVQDITGGTGRGIAFNFRKGHVVNGNIIKGCDVGIDLFSATYVVITSNTFTSTTTSITNSSGTNSSANNLTVV